MTGPTPERDRQLHRLVLGGTALLFLLLLVRTAWLSDDAYITFRTVDNFLNGYGLRWNVANRVQAYTHPLWMFLMSGAAAITGEVYFTAIALSIAASLGAFLLVAGRLAASAAAAALAFAALSLSKAFVDYSTSGLENPLTHLLLAAFFLVYFLRRAERGRVLVLAFLASLVMVNRLDAGLLVLPALAVAVVRHGIRRSLAPILIGFLPLIAWEAFSVIYYGFPFPNTAYSKLKTGIPRSELLAQGVLYLFDSLSNDPLTLTVIAAALLSPLVAGAGWVLPIGSALYVVYTVWVGGDFMSGRFLAGPYFCSVIQIARQPFAGFGGAWAAAIAVVVGLGLSVPRPTLVSDARYGSDIEIARLIAPTGITDERRFYYPQSGLLTVTRGTPRPNHKWIHMGHDLRARGERFFYTDAAGYIGYAAGPGVYLLDKYGLGDPLVARLPAETPWRIGHFLRREPDGYRETLLSGRNSLRDSGLAAYYERLKIITEDPIWSGRRWRTIVSMNLGSYEHFLDSYGVVQVPAKELASPGDGRQIAFGFRGLEARFEAPTRVARLELSVSRNDRYEIVLVKDGRAVSAAELDQLLSQDGAPALHTIMFETPAEADLVRVLPSGGDSRYTLGVLRVAP